MFHARLLYPGKPLLFLQRAPYVWRVSIARAMLRPGLFGSEQHITQSILNCVFVDGTEACVGFYATLKCKNLVELQLEMFEVAFVSLYVESDFYLPFSSKESSVHSRFCSFLRVTCTLDTGCRIETPKSKN